MRSLLASWTRGGGHPGYLRPQFRMAPTIGPGSRLGPRGTHRIEPPLHDAILLERPETLRQCRWSNAIQRVLQVLKASRTMLEEIAQDEASPARSNDAECVGHRAFCGCGLLLRHVPFYQAITILAIDYAINSDILLQ